MGHNERRSYLLAIRARYLSAGRLGKAKILDEFCAVCGYNRKYAIRILNKKPAQPRKKPGPKPKYQSEAILEPLKKIWFTADQPCSRKLKEIIPAWLPCYEETYGALSEEIRDKLLKISRATIDRLLSAVRTENRLKGRCTTKPGSLIKSKIPIQTGQWDIKKPGYLEADTVAHCGNTTVGKFAWSITITDICTGWTENRAVWNKRSAGIYHRISEVETTLPFETLGFDSDNGSEFINKTLLDYFTNRDKPVQFTRSRPYKKNDNAHVEQKNWTHVRHLLGYDRIDNIKAVKLINDLYRNEWSLYQNYFMPSMKLIDKQRVGAKYKKKYDKPMTPFERILVSEHIDQATKDKLNNNYKKLNPFTLKAEIERKLSMIFKHVSVTSKVRHRL